MGSDLTDEELHDVMMRQAMHCLCGLCAACEYAKQYADSIRLAITNNGLGGERIPSKWREAVALSDRMKSTLNPHADACEITLLGRDDPMASCNCAKPELQRARQWVYELIQTARTQDLDKLRAVLMTLDKAQALLRIAPQEEHAR
jgi:hypothetical protein